MLQGSVSVRRRLFALSQLLFSLAILTGSSFEVVNLLVPSLIPQIQDMPLMRLHHSSRIVFYWSFSAISPPCCCRQSSSGPLSVP